MRIFPHIAVKIPMTLDHLAVVPFSLDFANAMITAVVEDTGGSACSGRYMLKGGLEHA